MKSVEEFFLEHHGPSSPSAVTTRQLNCRSALPDEAREAANEISRLEELAAEYFPLCGWRVVVGSALCVVELDGQQGRNSYAALAQDQEECLTLQSGRGDTALAFYRRPRGLVLRASARKLAPGVRILAEGDSCVIGPFSNPWAEVEAVPYWSQDLAFETADTPHGKAAPVPALFLRPAPCRTSAQFKNPQACVRKCYPVCGHAGVGRGGSTCRSPAAPRVDGIVASTRTILPKPRSLSYLPFETQSRKVIEIVRRGRGFTGMNSPQALDEAVALGRGGTWLELDANQLQALSRPS
jgi:hypothetical protein